MHEQAVAEQQAATSLARWAANPEAKRSRVGAGDGRGRAPAVRVSRLVAAKAALRGSAAAVAPRGARGSVGPLRLERPRDANTAAEDAAHLLTVSPTPGWTWPSARQILIPHVIR